MSERLLQRKCACGGSGGDCEECRSKKVQRKAADGAARQSSIPPVVHQTLRSPGQPLDTRTRRVMESRLGHDFGNIRVHADETASRSAKAIGAQAYTSQNDIVFGAGRYAPSSTEGRRLLAHELTHAIQQRHNNASDGPLRIAEDHVSEAEADRAADRAVRGEPAAMNASSRAAGIQRQPLGDDPFGIGHLHIDPIPPPMLIRPGSIRETYVIPAPPHIELTPPTFSPPGLFQRPSLLPGTLTAPTFTPVILIPAPRCFPSTPLTWANFQGTPRPASGFSAETHATVREENVQGNIMFQAVMDDAASWVLPEPANPGARAKNGCNAKVARCQAFFDSLQPNQTGRFPTTNTCAASPSPTSAEQATTRAECSTVYGPACDRLAPIESARLLAHEQGHFDITCVLVGKADDALFAGTSLATVRVALRNKLAATQRQYDNQTNHGCNPGPQATWTTNIAGGLPAITIP